MHSSKLFIGESGINDICLFAINSCSYTAQLPSDKLTNKLHSLGSESILLVFISNPKKGIV